MAAAYRPRPELQKAAPRNLDAFLRRGKKASKFLRCARCFFVGFLKRAFCNSELRQGDRPFACRNQAAETKDGNAMTCTKIVIDEQTDTRIILAVDHGGKRWEIDVRIDLDEDVGILANTALYRNTWLFAAYDWH